MDTSGIAMIILGVVLIAVGIFGKIRPDILYRNYDRKTAFGGAFRLFGFSAARLGDQKMPSEVKQRLCFMYFVLFGAMLILVSIVTMVPQWEAYKSAIAISIVMAITIVMIFSYWKIMLSQNERWRTLGLVAVLLLSVALIALAVYYWMDALK